MSELAYNQSGFQAKPKSRCPVQLSGQKENKWWHHFSQSQSSIFYRTNTPQPCKRKERVSIVEETWCETLITITESEYKEGARTITHRRRAFISREWVRARLLVRKPVAAALQIIFSHSIAAMGQVETQLLLTSKCRQRRDAHNCHGKAK